MIPYTAGYTKNSQSAQKKKKYHSKLKLNQGWAQMRLNIIVYHKKNASCEPYLRFCTAIKFYQ